MTGNEENKWKFIMGNLLIYGDNLKALEYLINQGYENSVDLIYIDPPYNTGRIFRVDKNTGKTRTISNTGGDIIAYEDNKTFTDYLQFMEDRIRLLYQLLSDEGSFYLHIDYKVGHYIKVLCDKIFGMQNFRMDITRLKSNPKNSLYKNYGCITDCILFYTKTKNNIWNTPYKPYTDEELNKKYPKKDNKGYYNTQSLTAPGEVKNGATGQDWNGLKPPKGRHWARPPYELTELDNQGLIEWSKNGNPRLKKYRKDSKGRVMQDLWLDYKDPPRPMYPTQKNNKLISRIIKTSSNPNSIVLDAFMGSGTTLMEAYKNNRKWIGIDQSTYAIQTFKEIYNKIPNILTNNKKYDYIEL